MSNMAQKLRESAKETFYDPLKKEFNQAADHIEKLEAALREIASFKASFAQEWASDALEIARAALGETCSD